MRSVPDGLSQTERLLAVMKRLRDPETGCPWDKQQDFRSIAPFTIEEAYEVADAIERDDMSALRAELGDLLFQVVFHAHMADELDAFDFEEVARGVADKLERRHPHVFGTAAIADVASQSRSWEMQKAEERLEAGQHGALDGVPLGLPALSRAEKLGKRAALRGFDWPDISGVLDKVDEEREELREAMDAQDRVNIEHEFGDLMFALVNLARHLHIDPEGCVRAANRRFETRFNHVERGIVAEGKKMPDLGIEDLEARWQRAKQAL